MKIRKSAKSWKTFAKAEILKDENKTVVNINLPENRLVEVETYRELLEKFYPNDERENNKYKLSSFGENTLNRAREKGQDETIKSWREETRNNVYQNNVSANVFLTEQIIIEKFDKIKDFQQDARKARLENVNLLEKYVRRTATKIQTQKLSVPNSSEQKEIVLTALTGRNINLDSNQIKDSIFVGQFRKKLPSAIFRNLPPMRKFCLKSKQTSKMNLQKFRGQRMCWKKLNSKFQMCVIEVKIYTKLIRAFSK